MNGSKEISGRVDHEGYWREHVESWRKSGLSQAGYARQSGIQYHTLKYWKRKLVRAQQDCASRPLVVPVPMALLSGRVTAQAVEESHAGAFRLHLAGYDLEIPPDFVAPALVRLLECLERRQ
jgi:hypothetical protein